MNTFMIGQGYVFLAAVYFLPSMISWARGHRSQGAIFATNLFLGWIGIGWVVALIWAFTGNTHANKRRDDANLAAAFTKAIAHEQDVRRLAEDAVAVSLIDRT